MKKATLILLMLVFLGGLMACYQPQDGSTDLKTIYQDIVSLLPNVINHDFDIPKYAAVRVVFIMDERRHEGVFRYESPYFDTRKDLHIELTYAKTTETFTHSVVLAAIDSAINEHTLYLEFPRHLLTREQYVDASIAVYTQKNGQPHLHHHTQDLEVRGRGNSTWFMPKPPLRLRFKENTSLLGMPAARNYVLLAEYSDPSLIRNTLVHKFSRLLSHIEYNLSTRTVEVYINQEYMGVYTLTEHVEIHSNKLWFESAYPSLDAGYFLEQDQRLYQSVLMEGRDWFQLGDRAYQIKVPNPSSSAHVQFIFNQFQELENRLLLRGDYTSMMDVDNFIHYFIAQELFKNVDLGFSSVFIYKKPHDPIRMGPLWDFDLAMGNANYIDYGPEGFYGFAADKNRWYYLMMQIPEIRMRYRDLYNDIYFDIIPLLLDMIEPMGLALSEMAARNFNRWPILNRYVWPNPPEMVALTTHYQHVLYVKHYLEHRANWMYQAVNDPSFITPSS